MNMGLDMYMFKCKKESVNELVDNLFLCKEKDRESMVCYEGIYFKLFESEDLEYKSELLKLNPIVRWRKANQIFGWFVNNIGEKGKGHYPIVITKEGLSKLYNDCKRIIATSKKLPNGKMYFDKGLCKKIMPPYKGPMFGSCEIDNTYLRDVKYTLERVGNILLTTNFNTEAIVYFSDY